MRRKLLIIIAALAVTALFPLPVSAYKSEEYLREFNDSIDEGMLEDREQRILQTIRSNMLSDLNTVCRIHIFKTGESSAQIYAENYVNSVAEKFSDRKTLILLVFFADTNDVGIAVKDISYRQLENSDFYTTKMNFESADGILSQNIFNSLCDILDVLIDKTTEEIRYADLSYLPNYMAHKVSEKESGKVGVTDKMYIFYIGIAVMTVILLAALIIFYIKLRKKSSMRYRLLAGIAAITLTAAAALWYFTVYCPVHDESGNIKIKTVSKAAVPVYTENLLELDVSALRGRNTFSYGYEKDGFENILEWMDISNENPICMYTRYTSAVLAEKKYQLYEDYNKFFAGSKLEKIEGPNFKLLISGMQYNNDSETQWLYSYYLLIDDAVYYFTPYQSELPIYREMFENMNLSPDYLKKTIDIMSF